MDDWTVVKRVFENPKGHFELLESIHLDSIVASTSSQYKFSNVVVFTSSYISSPFR